MALDEIAEIEIRRPADEVAAYMFEPTNDPAWIGGISESESLEVGMLRQGSRVRRRARFMGRRIDYVMEIVHLDPNRRLAMHAVEAPMPMDVTYEVEPRPGGSLARVRVQGDAGGLYRIGGPLVSAQVGRSIAKDVRDLKRLLESGPES
ncbi:MAG: SRPBCC family protein [Chloroflexi bacterium]|nr:SRPBCC family protein [Chloroflexota bacterium]